MNNCKFCRRKWGKRTAEIYQRALNELNGDILPLHFGPAHIVWEDDNLDCAQSCIDTFEKYSGNYEKCQLAIVRKSLEELALVPESELWIDDNVPCPHAALTNRW